MIAPRTILTGLCALPVMGCGLVGLDAYGRPDPCQSGGKPATLPSGEITCVNTFAEIVLTGTLPPTDPEIQRKVRQTVELARQPVAYTDGKLTVTMVPPIDTTN